ncbi:Flagellar basal-body rod protein FlgG [Paraliobacillus sp. PM-2]|uniref:flagellar hook-basal body protein n=1 Tax=Paraliobacillus sp. PM-2 TaxID=1462524 RepID=UPI00061C2CB8|nr:flagellar hook-basal body protein [Paraliobacillus sp. PM-2]CQR46181.1 Flagellar basal-body rod protein FlgG [Paraliobacillus sp. PM-2]
MLRGYYTAASGMMTQQRRQDVLSNNIANAQTPGYKQDQTTVRAFPELLIQRMGNKEMPTMNGGLDVPDQQTIGSIHTGVYVQETIPDFEQGAMKKTGLTTDMALVNGALPDQTGGIFFTVQDNDGNIRYTRNGNFTVDGEGFLTTSEGLYLLDENGDPMETDGQSFNVTDEGMIQVGNETVPIGIAYSANVNDLVKDGEGLFALDEAGATLGNARENLNVSFTVQQKYLESSNVNTVQTMTDMMQAYRMFETNQKVLQAYDQSMDKAVNQIARLT